MACGHRPQDIDEYPWDDVAIFLAALPEIHANRNMTTTNE